MEKIIFFTLKNEHLVKRENKIVGVILPVVGEVKVNTDESKLGKGGFTTSCDFLEFEWKDPTIDFQLSMFSVVSICGTALIVLNDMGYDLNDRKSIKKAHKNVEEFFEVYQKLMKEKPELFGESHVMELAEMNEGTQEETPSEEPTIKKETQNTITSSKDPIMYLEGTDNSTITIYNKKIVIVHSGFKATVSGKKGEHTIMIKDIVAIELVKGSMGSRSSIFFNHKGLERQSGDDSNFGLRSLEVAGSPNAVLFTKENYDSFKELKEKVEELMGEVGTSSSTIVNEVSIPDEIKKLSDLKDQGILTEEEFQTKKTDLLNKM